MCCFLSPHPSTEGRGSRPGSCMWLGSNWKGEGWWWRRNERRRANINRDAVDVGLKLRSSPTDSVQYERLFVR
jgi:hypothetical protein